MKRKVFLIGLVAISILGLFGCSSLFNPTPTGNTPAKTPITLTPSDPARLPPPEAAFMPPIAGEYIEGQIVVGYKNSSVLQDVAHHVGGTVIGEIEELKAGLIELPADLPVPLAIAKISRAAYTGELQGIRYAEPNYIRHMIQPVRTDEILKSLEPTVYDPNTDLRRYQWGLDAVNAGGAWSYAQGYGIIVAVIDSGVDGTHPDLQGQVIGEWYDAWNGTWVTGVDSSWDAWTVSEEAPREEGAHGTHVAGIIAAKDDGMGILGLAPHVQILSVRIFSPDALDHYITNYGLPISYVGDFNVARGIVEAVDYGADVLSNSWGGKGYSQLIKAAIDYAIVNGAVFVVAMGNSSTDEVEYPAAYPGVIAVGATTPGNERADFSTMGGWISVGAPGTGILSCIPRWWEQDGTGAELLYDYWPGTSMATPFVSALAALVLERHPGATPYQVKRLIETTAMDIEAPGFDRESGYGLINAAAAVAANSLPPDGGYVEIYVKTQSGISAPGGVSLRYADIILRKDGVERYFGQTDFDGWFGLGFPYDPNTGSWGTGAFYGIEPGTYEVIVGGEDMTWPGYYDGWWGRVANRVTATATVTVGSGDFVTETLYVNTALQVTISWNENQDVDLGIEIYNPLTGGTVGYYTPKTGCPYGTFSGDAQHGGSETFTLTDPHYDYAIYYPVIDTTNASGDAIVSVQIVQNGVTENYGPYIASAGEQYRSDGWPDWWETHYDPIFGGLIPSLGLAPGGPIVY